MSGPLDPRAPKRPLDIIIQLMTLAAASATVIELILRLTHR